MTQLFAQPYDISATGFYFETAEEYKKNANALRNEYGDPVEEFEIQFIDGEEIDCDLARTIGLNQANLVQFLDCIDDWDEGQKQQVINHFSNEDHFNTRRPKRSARVFNQRLN